MKIRHAILSLGLITAISNQAFADHMKLAVIDVDKVIQSAPQLPKIQHALEEKFNARHIKIVKLQKELESEQEKFHKNVAVMSASEKNKMISSITKKTEDFKQQQAKFEKDFMQARNEKLQGLLSQVKGIVDKIADKEDYDMVLSRSSTPYARDRFDITNSVIDKLK